MKTTGLEAVAFAVSCACIAAAMAGLASAQTPPAPSPPKPLRVIAFEGGHNLPIWAAQRQGFFEQNGVKVSLTFTPSSTFLVSSLFESKSDLGVASIDNVIAYQEGQGETKIPDNPDLFAFMGVDEGFLSLVTAPAVKSFADLRGKTLSVDAMTTGYAFALREMVLRGGLKESEVSFVRAGGTGNRYRDLMAGRHDGTLLRTPFELLARDRGFNVLATGAELGPYLGTVGVARRSWARENEEALLGFLRGYRAGLDWVHEPMNRDIAEALLVANIRDMAPPLAKRSCDVLLAAKGGLIKDMSLAPARIKTVLALRSKFAEPRKNLTDPSKYIDASYLEKAVGSAGKSSRR